MRITVEDNCQKTKTFTEGILKGLVVSYRPVSADGAQKHIADSTTPWIEKRAKLISSQVVSWNATKADGSPLPIDFETCKTLAHPAIEAITELILGYAASDEYVTAAKN